MVGNSNLICVTIYTSGLFSLKHAWIRNSPLHLPGHVTTGNILPALFVLSRRCRTINSDGRHIFARLVAGIERRKNASDGCRRATLFGETATPIGRLPAPRKFLKGARWDRSWHEPKWQAGPVQKGPTSCAVEQAGGVAPCRRFSLNEIPFFLLPLSCGIHA